VIKIFSWKLLFTGLVGLINISLPLFFKNWIDSNFFAQYVLLQLVWLRIFSVMDMGMQTGITSVALKDNIPNFFKNSLIGTYLLYSIMIFLLVFAMRAQPGPNGITDCCSNYQTIPIYLFTCWIFAFLIKVKDAYDYQIGYEVLRVILRLSPIITYIITNDLIISFIISLLFVVEPLFRYITSISVSVMRDNFLELRKAVRVSCNSAVVQIPTSYVVVLIWSKITLEIGSSVEIASVVYIANIASFLNNSFMQLKLRSNVFQISGREYNEKIKTELIFFIFVVIPAILVTSYLLNLNLQIIFIGICVSLLQNLHQTSGSVLLMKLSPQVYRLSGGFLLVFQCLVLLLFYQSSISTLYVYIYLITVPFIGVCLDFYFQRHV